MKLFLVAATTVSLASAQLVLTGDDTGAVGNANSAAFSVAIGDENVIPVGSDYSIAMGQGANAVNANAFVFAGTSDDGAGDKPSQGVDTATFWVSDIYLGDRALGAEITTLASTLDLTNTLAGNVLATVTGHTTDIANLQAEDVTVNANVATNAANIATNTGDIATNAGGIATVAAIVTTNTADVATNTGDIATNAAGVATNAAGVATNAAGVAANAADVATNAASAAANAGDIATLQTDVAALQAADVAIESDIVDLQTAVTQAQADIAVGTAERGTLEANIDTVAADLATLQANFDFTTDAQTDAIQDNAVDIATNTDSLAQVLVTLATHTSQIDTNQGDISNNIADIDVLHGQVDAVVVDAGANTAAIAGLVDAVAVLQEQVAALLATTEAPPTDPPPPADFAFLTGQCDGDDYCTIETAGQCEAGATYLGFGDTVAGVKSLTNKVAGCYTTTGGSLIFNENLASTEVHNTGNGQMVICALCDSRRGLRGY